MSYIITHRSSSPDREANLYTVTNFLVQNVPEIEIIVVEQDSQPSPLFLPSTVKHIFAKNDGLFNRSWGFNIGYRKASHDAIAFGDNDIILPPEAIRESSKLCLKHGTISPYSRTKLLDLTQEYTKKLSMLCRIPEELHGTWRIAPYAGGVLFMSKEAFKTVGGWEERIRGWGGEDDHMTIKIVKLVGRCQELQDSYALHLYHQLSNLYMHQDIKSINPHYLKNLDLIESIKHMPDNTLKQLCSELLPSIGHIPPLLASDKKT